MAHEAVTQEVLIPLDTRNLRLIYVRGEGECLGSVKCFDEINETTEMEITLKWMDHNSQLRIATFEN